jgi:hypothetical protein
MLWAILYKCCGWAGNGDFAGFMARFYGIFGVGREVCLAVEMENAKPQSGLAFPRSALRCELKYRVVEDGGAFGLGEEAFADHQVDHANQGGPFGAAMAAWRHGHAD